MKIITRKKNNTPHFKEHCTKIDDISLVVIRFFFSQTNLVCKSNPVFIDILDSFCHNLFTFLPLDFYLYSRDFEVHPIHVRLSTKTSKVLMRFSVLFVRFSSSKCACVLFSIKHSYLKEHGTAVNGEKTTDVNNYVTCTCHARVLCKLDAAFGVWLWPELRYVVCSYMPSHFCKHTYFKRII